MNSASAWGLFTDLYIGASFGAAFARRCVAFKTDLINWRLEQHRSFLTRHFFKTLRLLNMSSAAGFYYHGCLFLSHLFLLGVSDL